MAFEMVYFKKVSNNTAILAEFGIRIVKWDLTLYKMKMIKGKTGGTFIIGPSEKYQDKETGETKYSPYFKFGKDTDAKFQSEIKKFIDEHIAQHPELHENKRIEPDLLDEEIPF